MKLIFGVIDLPYVGHGGTTTGDVANILEARYKVMENFAGINAQPIADAMTNSMAGALETAMMGGHIGLPADVAYENLIQGISDQSPFASATEQIKSDFTQYITQEKEPRQAAPPVPTMAAREGRSKRFKSGYGPPRPSFIDSGLYLGSFKAWVDP